MEKYKFTKLMEGLRLEPYLDSEDVPTIGFGTTRYSDGVKVTIEDSPITEERANLEFDYYMEKEVEPQLNKYDWLNDNQREALASLIYNCGVLSKKCPKLHSALLKRNFKDIYKQWDYGLKNRLFTRRSKELELFFSYGYDK